MDELKLYIKKVYGFSVQAIEELSGGWLNRKYLIEDLIGNKFVFKIMSRKKVEKMSKNEYSNNYIEDKISETLGIENFLNENGVACPRVLKSKNDMLLEIINNEKCFMMEYFEGQSVDYVTSTFEHLYQIGFELSKMHSLLNVFPYIPIQGRYLKLKNISELEKDLSKRVIDARCSVSEKFKNEVSQHQAIVDFLKVNNIIERIPIALIHGDFAYDNILFGENSMCVIDFELLRENSPLQDIGRILLSLCLNEAGDLDLIKIESFLRGYNENLLIGIDDVYKSFVVVWINEVNMWIKKNYFENQITPKADRFLKEISWITHNWEFIVKNAKFLPDKNLKL